MIVVALVLGGYLLYTHKSSPVSTKIDIPVNNLTKVAKVAQAHQSGEKPTTIASSDELAKARAAAKDPKALYELALLVSKSTGLQNYKRLAVDLAEESGKLGCVEGMMLAGKFAQDGFGQLPNGQKALDWYQKAADAGDSAGDVAIARLLMAGQLMAADFDKAMVHIDKAIAAGNPEAYFLKGTALADDPATRAQAIELLKQSSALGYSDADLLLAKLGVDVGDGESLNDKITDLTQRGNIKAKVLNATKVINDPNSTADQIRQATDDLTAASAAGDSTASLRLATFLRANQQLSPDNLEAARDYAIKASQAGNAGGDFIAASTYVVNGAPQDLDQAMSWLKQGKADGDWRSSYALALVRAGGYSVQEAIQTASTGTFTDYTDFNLARNTGQYGIVPPTALYTVKPTMPAGIASVDATANVVALISLDETGKVTNVKIESSTHPEVNDAVISTLSTWKFQPATRNGVAVPFNIRQPIRFKGHS